MADNRRRPSFAATLSAPVWGGIKWWRRVHIYPFIESRGQVTNPCASTIYWRIQSNFCRHRGLDKNRVPGSSVC